MRVNKPGVMFVLSSPSGAGKTTLAKMLEKDNTNFVVSISHTTRKPRTNEKHGLDYYFVSRAKFSKLVKEKKFFEHAKIFENYYGTLKNTVLKNISNGKDVLFDIDWQGTKQLEKKKNKLKLVTIFILPPDKTTLKNRLINRTKDGKYLIKKRMKKFKEEVSHWKDYDYTVINNNLKVCYNNLLSIIEAEKTNTRYTSDKSEVKNIIKNLIK